MARLHVAQHDTASALDCLRKSLAADPANAPAAALEKQLRQGRP